VVVSRPLFDRFDRLYLAKIQDAIPKQYFHPVHINKLSNDHKPSHLSSSSQRCFEMKAHCDYYDYHDIERDFEVAVNRGQIYNTDQHRSH
jgi:hypothetical protein